jgi:DNA-binding transcriptional LysR family regulator
MDPLLSGSDFAHLRAFVAVGTALSFTNAAEALGVSPSALSQLVRTLEERVGVRLLNRTTRSVALTEAGETLMRRVAPAVSELTSAVGQIRLYQQRPAGTVRVHSFRSAADLYIQPILAGFHARYPDIVLDVTVDDAVVDIVAGGFDVAIRIGEVIEQDMVAVRLGPDIRQRPVASPEYLARRDPPSHPRDLLRHDCIRWRWPGHTQPYRWEFFEDGAWFEVAVTGPLIVNSKETALAAAIDGVGIAFAVEQAALRAITEGRLVPMLDAWCAPFPGHHLCYTQQRQMSPAVRAFIDALRHGPRPPSPTPEDGPQAFAVAPFAMAPSRAAAGIES